ncbi:hypothetical protein JTB14_009747 [Gonioctena quinquepunctata]|nr:hypothetical protein JTB14_009747 [Gonioctena quinquepunctata]
MKRSWDLPQKDLKYYADHLSDIHCVDDPLTTHSGDDFVHDSEDNGGSELEDNAESGNDDDETSSTEEQNEVGMEIEEESDGSWNGEVRVQVHISEAFKLFHQRAPHFLYIMNSKASSKPLDIWKKIGTVYLFILTYALMNAYKNWRNEKREQYSEQILANWLLLLGVQ